MDLNLLQSHQLRARHFLRSWTSFVLRKVDAHHEPNFRLLHNQRQSLIVPVHFHGVESEDLFHRGVSRHYLQENAETSPSIQYANLENLDPKENPKSSEFVRPQLSRAPNLHGTFLRRHPHVHGDVLALAIQVGFQRFHRSPQNYLLQNKRNHHFQHMHGHLRLNLKSFSTLIQLFRWLLDILLLVLYLAQRDLDESSLHIYAQYQRDPPLRI